MKLPEDVRDHIRNLLWERATDLGWSGLADTERSRYYEQWTRETAIGGTLAYYMDPRKVRVYIKDSLLKPYERARLSATEQDILATLNVDPTLEVVHRYIKPHGLRFIGGQIISWGKSRDWKLILMAIYERTALNHGASSFGTVLLESGNTVDDSTRILVRGAATRLGIVRVEWID
ncbi:hypothetical protein AL509_01055 [Achromobacter xylosoxidans]|uniref:hypothetical protein n=1 Tax=Alcaligenes xylosoxydans xylosoxydans TaxID=85698 RepID=UPI000CDBDCCA|nr:hypothetical protein [Achromobacter xylosoxidans]AMH04168.2 hypothetical protein AL509_01055 [Achromobacter xylosoxidans]